RCAIPSERDRARRARSRATAEMGSGDGRLAARRVRRVLRLPLESVGRRPAAARRIRTARFRQGRARTRQLGRRPRVRRGQGAQRRRRRSLGGRRVFLAGMIGSIAATLALGVSGTLAAFIAFWSVNRFIQSAGWSSLVKIAAHWYPPERSGRIMGVL